MSSSQSVFSHTVRDADEARISVVETTCREGSSACPSVQNVSQLPEKENETLIIDWMEEQQCNSAPIIAEIQSRDDVELVEMIGKKRKRDAGAKSKTHLKAVDPSLVAFRQSQKLMRKESKHLCIKDIFRKSSAMSPTLAMEIEDSSLSIMSPCTSLSSAWSPQMANDLTSQFLSSVEAEKKKRFERIVSRDVGNSQQSMLSSPMASTDKFQCDDVLVICDEDANIGPPPVERCLRKDELSEAESSKTSILQKEFYQQSELEQQLEKERSAALARKHQIRELRQRRKKAEALLSVDSITEKEGVLSRPVLSVGSSFKVPELFTPMPLLHGTRHQHDLSIGESKLSTDDISMIQRINSFEKTSAPKVVVFSSTSSAVKS